MSDVETIELVGGVSALVAENEAMARRINELEAELARRPSDLEALRAMLERAGVKIVRDEDYGSQRWRLVAESGDGEWYRFEFRETAGRLIGLG